VFIIGIEVIVNFVQEYKEVKDGIIVFNVTLRVEE